MLQIPFSIEVEALNRVAASAHTSENACLSAFDAVKSTIHSAAREAYAHTRKTNYILTVKDFRR